MGKIEAHVVLVDRREFFKFDSSRLAIKVNSKMPEELSIKLCTWLYLKWWHEPHESRNLDSA